MFRAPPALLDQLRLSAETRRLLADPDWAAVEDDRRWLDGPGRHLLTPVDDRYPCQLRETADPPLALFVVGEPHLLGRAQLAVVGARHPTPAGARTAYEFAQALAGCGLTITSGLALGIDAAAHRGALAAGQATVAVLGTGVDRIYPPRNRDLAEVIAARGAMVSEYPRGTPARPYHFPRRNRIIGGLSLGTLVVEAGTRSGALITARLASEEGREVFAIPGSIHNPLARGCHGLIRQGAKLVETVADVLEEFPAWRQRPAPAPVAQDPPLDASYQGLLTAMGYEPVAVDELVESTGLTPEAVSSMLLVLELHDLVARADGGRYTRLSRATS